MNAFDAGQCRGFQVEGAGFAVRGSRSGLAVATSCDGVVREPHGRLMVWEVPCAGLPGAECAPLEGTCELLILNGCHCESPGGRRSNLDLRRGPTSGRRDRFVAALLAMTVLLVDCSPFAWRLSGLVGA